MNPTRTQNYLALLSIQKSARQRDTLMIGGVFLISFIAMVFLNLSSQLSGRSLTIVGALLVVFGISFLMSWVRLEIIRSTIDLIENIRE